MIRGIRLFNTKSIGITLPLNRVQTRSFINSTSKSISIINKINNNSINKNHIINQFIRSYSTNNSNNSSNSENIDSVINSSNSENINSGINNSIGENINQVSNTINNNGAEALASVAKKYPDFVIAENFIERNSSFESFGNLKLWNIEFLNGLHEINGFPWIAIIAGMSLALRVATFPVTLRTQKISARMKEVRKEAEKHSYLNDGTPEGRVKAMQLQQQLMQKKGLSFMSMLGPNLIILPLLVYPFLVIREICESTTLLNNVPGLWVDSLGSADPYYILPIISSLVQYLSVRITTQADSHPIMKGIMYGLCFLPLIFTCSFPAALNIYWFTNSVLFCVTNLFFKSKWGSSFFNLPYEDPATKASKQNTIVIAPEHFTQVKNIEEKSTPVNTVLQDQIAAKKELIEKKREELKAFRRKK